MTEWLSSIGPAVGNHLWQSTAFAAVVWLATLLLRRNQARVRYGLWLAASVKFLIPFSLLVGLGGLLPKPHHVVVAVPVSYAMDTVAQPFTEMPMDIAPTVTRPSPMQRFEHLLPLALGTIWLCGVLVVLAIWGVRWRQVAKTLRQAVRVEDGREWEILRRLQKAMGAGGQIPLLMSQKLMEPGMFGIFRPVLIWPQRLSERLDDEHTEAILAHELGHAQRRDNLTAVIHMAVEAAFWFHPLVWWMERRMVEERERACDEAVVEMGSRPGIYAESLLKACRFCVESPLVCVSGITGADLSKRVLSIMTLRLERMSMGKKAALALFGIIVIATPILLGQFEAAQRVMLAAANAAPIPFRTAARAMIAEEQTPSTALIAEVQAPAGVPEGGATEIQSDAKPLAFDVVSIRPAEPSNRAKRTGFQFTDDGIVVTNQSLELMLMLLYQSELQPGPNGIIGGSDWVRTLQWDIRGRVADSDIAEWSKLSKDLSAQAIARRIPTIQAMLADRFKLKMHFETKEGTVYALVLAKGGPKLKPSTSVATTRIVMNIGPGHISSEQMTIAGVARFLKLQLGYPVIDKTGITGQYDLTLDWTPDPGAAGAPNGEAGQASTPNDVSKPSVFTALQEQLGLKLEVQKGPIETLVIDSAEKPSVDGAEVQGQASVMPVAMVQEKAAQTDVAALSPEIKFDVVSFKPYKPGGVSSPKIDLPLNGDYVAFHGVPMQKLLMFAYARSGYFVVSGEPEWVDSDRYDFQAKVAEQDLAAWQAMSLTHKTLMVRALLEDMLKLKVHPDTAKHPIYDLVVAKGGPKMQKWKEGDTVKDAKGNVHAEKLMFWFTSDKATCQEATMADLVNSLSGPNRSGRVVVDKTGLTGKYNFTLPIWYQGAPNEDEPSGESIFTAVESLGLRLVPDKGTVRGIVVDHIERPPEN
jgi:uncharacterized protein (TIGR03435 family)